MVSCVICLVSGMGWGGVGFSVWHVGIGILFGADVSINPGWLLSAPLGTLKWSHLIFPELQGPGRNTVSRFRSADLFDCRRSL